MPIEKPDYELKPAYEQLALDLDLPEIESDAVSPEEARLRSETARQALEVKSTDEIPWLEDYQELRRGGWPWRQSVYIAWMSQPVDKRMPKTQDQLAKLMGLTSDRAFSTWRKRNPAIDEMITMLQSAPLFKHRADIYAAMVNVATTGGYKGFNDRKLAAEIMGDYVPSSKLAAELTKRLTSDDLANMTDAELEKLAKDVLSHAPTGVGSPDAGSKPARSSKKDDDGA